MITLMIAWRPFCMIVMFNKVSLCFIVFLVQKAYDLVKNQISI